MPATKFVECKYSVFFSYAFRDNSVTWPNWIDRFHRELSEKLPPRISGIEVPPIYFASLNGPKRGWLDDNLREAVGQSFAMIIFVAPNYLDSSWCLDELRHFKTIFSPDDFVDRLYVMAKSKAAVTELKKGEKWRGIFGNREFVHIEFHRKDDESKSHRALAMFVTDERNRDMVPATEFWTKFQDFTDDLLKLMNDAVVREAPATGYPTTSASPRVTADDFVRVYIEADQRQNMYWESLQRQVVAKWDEVVAEERDEPALYLRPERFKAGDRPPSPALELANGVILLWAKKTAASVADLITAIEPHLPGAAFAPGIVAYLSTGPDDTPPQDSIQNWPVIGFRVREADGSTTVLGSYAERLREYMSDVLKHKRGA